MTNIFKLAAAVVFLSSAPAFAQDPSPAAFDSRWNPYLGCWSIAQGASQHPVAVPSGTMVCVRPSGPNAVTITTTVDGKQVLEQTVVADGSPQPVSKADCSGTYVSDWSRDGERLFTRVELQCSDRPTRSVSGITLLANGYWIDSQATLVDGDHDVRVRRYRRSADQYTGTRSATQALSIEDVIEASKKVQSHALEAALDEAEGRFTLNSRTLTQLADGGVSPNVIDLMVAQAYPDRFRVERGVYPASGLSSSGGLSSGGLSSGGASIVLGSAAYSYPAYDPFYDPYYYYSPFAYPYYWGAGYGYRFGYPYPYRSYNLYNSPYYSYPYYNYPGGGYSFDSGSGDSTAKPGSPDSPGGNGIVVNGRGYTRVRPSSGSGDNGGDATPRSRSAPTGTRSVNSGSDSSSSSGSGGSVSSGGYSSGGNSSGGNSGSSSSGGGSRGGDSGGGGGRTAQPR